MRDLLHLDDDDIWDLQHPMRVDVDDPMFIPDRIDRAEMAGSIFSSIAHAVTAPVRAVANIAQRTAMAPLYGLEHAVNALTPGKPGGGGGGGGDPSAPAPDDGSATADPGDGGEIQT